MATAEMRMHPNGPGVAARRSFKDPAGAVLRLLEVGRSDQLRELLLDEACLLGFTRLVLLELNLDNAELSPISARRCSDELLQRLRLSVFGSQNELVETLNSGEPAIRKFSGFARPVYCHPLIFQRSLACAEAQRGGDCLGVLNHATTRRLRLEEQTCATCHMPGYALLLVAEVPRNGGNTADLAKLVEGANYHLGHLYKTEYYFARLSEAESTIAQMGTVMQSMADPVILTDQHHRVVLQNSAAERFFKLPEQVSDGRIRAVELNNLLFSAALSSTAVSGGDTTHDLTLVDAIEGEELLFEAVCAPTFGRDGQPIGMVTVMRDVTDLRRADQELRNNYDRIRAAELSVRQDRDRLNLIIENVGEPIIVCDASAKPVLMDPLAQNLFGSGNESDPNLMKNQAQLDAYITAFTFSFSDKESAQIHLWNPESNSETEYDARSGKIYDERGQTAFTVTVLRDLTSLRKVEQLKMERRMLEIEKFAATGRLAATIAHEVNNPMEAIKNAIYLLAGSVKPDAAPVYDILKSETERVARIVRQMLGLYRNNEQVRPANLNAVVEDTLLLLNRQLQRANIQVKTSLSELPDAVVAADQIRQVLSNLVINARDAMPEGGTLYVRTRSLRGEGMQGWIRLTIADTGTGIPPRLKAKIFEPFVTTKGEKGTGLGLWIVRGIVHDHGGRMKLRSKVGEGTVFCIDLPVVH